MSNFATVEFADQSSAFAAIRAAGSHDNPLSVLGHKLAAVHDPTGAVAKQTMLASAAGATEQWACEGVGHPGTDHKHARPHVDAVMEPRGREPMRQEAADTRLKWGSWAESRNISRDSPTTSQEQQPTREAALRGLPLNDQFGAHDPATGERRRGDDSKAQRMPAASDASGSNAAVAPQRRAWFGGREVPIYDPVAHEFRRPDSAESAAVAMEREHTDSSRVLLQAGATPWTTSRATSFDPARQRPWSGRKVVDRRLSRLLWLGDRGRKQPVSNVLRLDAPSESGFHMF